MLQHFVISDKKSKLKDRNDHSKSKLESRASSFRSDFTHPNASRGSSFASRSVGPFSPTYFDNISYDGMQPSSANSYSTFENQSQLTFMSHDSIDDSSILFSLRSLTSIQFQILFVFNLRL